MKIEYILIGILLFLSGAIVSQLYNSYHPIEITKECESQYAMDGVWVSDAKYLMNYTGSWACVNVGNIKSISRMIEECNHEIGHEIFARNCAKNITKCEGLE